jgi:hypothetical protein
MSHELVMFGRRVSCAISRRTVDRLEPVSDLAVKPFHLTAIWNRGEVFLYRSYEQEGTRPCER